MSEVSPGVHVDDLMGRSGGEFESTIWEVERGFDFAAGDVGVMMFKERQFTQTANCEIMIDMEHCKHELQQIEVSKSDKAKPERLLSAREMTRYRGGLGNIGWLADHCCPPLSFDHSERRRRQNDATTQDMLKLNKMIRSTKSIECKLKIPSISRNHLRFMRVHGAAHATVEGGASQQAHVILAVHTNM